MSYGIWCFFPEYWTQTFKLPVSFVRNQKLVVDMDELFFYIKHFLSLQVLVVHSKPLISPTKDQHLSPGTGITSSALKESYRYVSSSENT